MNENQPRNSAPSGIAWAPVTTLPRPGLAFSPEGSPPHAVPAEVSLRPATGGRRATGRAIGPRRGTVARGPRPPGGAPPLPPLCRASFQEVSTPGGAPSTAGMDICRSPCGCVPEKPSWGGQTHTDSCQCYGRSMCYVCVCGLTRTLSPIDTLYTVYTVYIVYSI